MRDPSALHRSGDFATQGRRPGIEFAVGSIGRGMLLRPLAACALALALVSASAFAQTKAAKQHRIGLLSPASQSAIAGRIEAFRQELGAQGYQDGKNL